MESCILQANNKKKMALKNTPYKIYIYIIIKINNTIDVIKRLDLI